MDEIKNEQAVEQAVEQAAAQPVEQGFKFRKSMGGFKKEDVIKFISEENRKFAEDRAALQSKIDEEVAKSEAAAKKSSELQLYYELLLKKRADDIAEKDAAIASASEKTEKAVADAVAEAKAEYDGKIAELGAKLAEAESREPERDTAKEESLAAELEEAKAKAEALKAENEALKAENEALKAENDALKAEAEELKAKYEEALAAVPVTDDEAVEELKALNEELKAKNDELKAEFDALKEEVENAEPDEEAEPFANDTPVTARESARQDGLSCGSQKASPCGAEAPQKRVSAFDQRPDEVSDSISSLLEEIAYRCRLLAAYIKIGAEKDDVARKIDEEFKK